MPASCRPPSSSTGGRPSCVVIPAPICRSGPATRSIGRRISEASPISVEAKDCPASRPIDRRIAVPALPMLSGAVAPCSPPAPAPCTITRVGSGRSICTPSARSARNVARQSSLARNPLMRVSPLAMPPSISARCEMDLSPGTVTSPLTRTAGATWYSCTAVTASAIS